MNRYALTGCEQRVTIREAGAASQTDTAAPENVAVTAQFLYNCPREDDIQTHSDMIHDDLCRLLDADSTTGVACQAVTIQRVVSDTAIYARARKHVICAVCGSTEVLKDAFAAWDADAGQWVLHSTHDETYCQCCDMATSAIEVSEASQLEIQAFGMVEDAQGSRLAEPHEAPAFFDVTVTTTPFESGVILVFEEHENMTAAQAVKALADMSAAYPTAPVSSVNCDLSA